MSELKCPKCAELEAELERVRKQAAAMREALQKHHDHASEACNVFFEQDGKPIDICTDLGEAYQDSSLCELTLDAMRADAGANYVSKEQVKPLVEALTRINEISVIDEDMGCAVNWAGDALTHARALGL